MFAAMQKDWELQQDFISGDTEISSIYFGGGTPSVVAPEKVKELIELVARRHPIKSGAEITLEANPEDISINNLRAWKQMGVNRISLGVQSLSDEELQWMNRAHSAQESLSAVALILDSGDFALSVDLIYGGLLKSHTQWEQELDWAKSSGIHHLSCYALTIEEKTALGKWAKKDPTLQPPDSHMEAQFLALSQWAQSNQWEHYEVSNLARSTNYIAQHNSGYWHGEKYWGIGPGAHGFNGYERRWNMANNPNYIKNIQLQEPYFETETLLLQDRANEMIMTQLRLATGLNLSQLEDLLSNRHFFSPNQPPPHPPLWESWLRDSNKTIESFHNKGWITHIPNRLILTTQGRLFADYIASELMFVSE